MGAIFSFKWALFPFSSLTIQQVSQEKEATEDKYKKERKKRMNTERRLRLAEDSLKRLDKALKDSGVKIDLQIETDVKNLKGKQSIFKYTMWPDRSKLATPPLLFITVIFKTNKGKKKGRDLAWYTIHYASKGSKNDE